MRIASFLSCFFLVLFFAFDANAASEKGPRCSDGIDNDGDGLIDSADPDCGGDGETGPTLEERIASLETSTQELTSVSADGLAMKAVSVDCTVSPDALKDSWGKILALSEVRVDLRGDCNYPGGNPNSLDFTGASKVLLTGEQNPDDLAGECLSTTKILDSGGEFGFQVDVGVQASVWLDCVQLGVTEPVRVSAYSGDYIRFDRVTAGSGVLDVDIKNGGLFRTFFPQAISSVRLRNNSLMEANCFPELGGPVGVAIPRIELWRSSHLVARGCNGTSNIDEMSLKSNSTAEFWYPGGADTNINNLSMKRSSKFWFIPVNNAQLNINVESVDADSTVLIDSF